NLKSVCADNPRFHIYSKSCPVLPRMLWGLRPEQVAAAHENCPFTFVRCGLIDPPPASLTLHRNRLSCGVPESLNMSLVMATAVMGNMLGDGQALNATWISAEEQQHFLYYSARVLANNQLLFAAFLCLLLVAVLRGPQLHESFHWRLQTVEIDPPHHALISIIQLQTLRVCLVALAFAGLLLPAYLVGAGYYTCGQPVGKTTAGYLSDSPVMELVVCCLWCCTTTAGTVALFTMPRQRRKGQGNETPSPRCLGLTWVCGRRIFFWMLWFFIVSTVSMPSILYSVAQALPANNTSGLSDHILAQLHRLAPILIVLLDMMLAMPLSNAYSKLTGMRADRLLMSMKLCSAWLLSLLATLLLHENCLGAWKWYWRVCDRATPEHQMFNLELWGHPILKTDEDICQLDRNWWRDGRCSRSIIEGLAPLLLKKLLVRTLAQPLVLLATWKLSRLEDNTASSHRGRHLKLFGIWPKTTRSLEQAQQGAMLTTLLETLIFWGPLIPLVVAGVLAAVVASSWLFAVGTRNFGVRLPASEGGLNADFSLSYMQGALFAGSSFQLWHAFGTGMCGRHLLAAHSALLLAFVCSPARRRLELDWAKALWGRSDLATRIASEVELM
ncbi:FLS2, partial [Symbiodinium microadriaticum]